MKSSWMFSRIISNPQLVVGLLLFGGASYILPFVSRNMLDDFKACGGLITLAVGMKIAGIKQSKVLNMLPALALAFPFSVVL